VLRLEQCGVMPNSSDGVAHAMLHHVCDWRCSVVIRCADLCRTRHRRACVTTRVGSTSDGNLRTGAESRFATSLSNFSVPHDAAISSASSFYAERRARVSPLVRHKDEWNGFESAHARDRNHHANFAERHSIGLAVNSGPVAARNFSNNAAAP